MVSLKARGNAVLVGGGGGVLEGQFSSPPPEKIKHIQILYALYCFKLTFIYLNLNKTELKVKGLYSEVRFKFKPLFLSEV